MKATIKLYRDEIESIIKEYLSKKPIEVTNITFWYAEEFSPKNQSLGDRLSYIEVETTIH